MNADTEDQEEREGRRAVTSIVERERCIYLECIKGQPGENPSSHECRMPANGQ